MGVAPFFLGRWRHKTCQSGGDADKKSVQHRVTGLEKAAAASAQGSMRLGGEADIGERGY